MSAQVLYHGFGIRGYRHLRMQNKEGALYFHVQRHKQFIECSICHSKQVIFKGAHQRTIRTLPIGNKPVFIVVHAHRLECKHCTALSVEAIPLSFPRKHWTKALGCYIVGLLKRATVKDVAQHLGMSWDTVKEIHVWALRTKYKRRPIKYLRLLGVDEVAIRKGYIFLTVVLNLVTGEVVWIGEGKTIQALEPFIRRLKRAGVKLEAVAMDMCHAYWEAVTRYYPTSVIVYDRFHIIGLYHDMLDELRQRETAIHGREHKGIYQGIRYLLFYGEDAIQSHMASKAKLKKLLSINERLNTAYVLKEELRHLWDCSNREAAELYFTNWFLKCQSSTVSLIRDFARRIAKYRTGILNYFDHPITTGPVEGFNNKIKVLKRQAYGFRDIEYFKLRIFNLHNSRYELVG